MLLPHLVLDQICGPGADIKWHGRTTYFCVVGPNMAAIFGSGPNVTAIIGPPDYY